MNEHEHREVVPHHAADDADGTVVVPAGTNERITEDQGGLRRRENVVTNGMNTHREQVVHDVAAERLFLLNKLSQLIWTLTGIVEVVLALRFVLKLIAANPGAQFTAFVYNIGGIFMSPFAGVTGSPAAGGSVLEVPALIAMLVYALLAWGVVRILWIALERPHTRSTSTYDRFAA
jgi:hypothetical protein